ncbi:MAG TPA: membrane dipeptidase [Cyclobacteriaceae bacterium]|nr:membrane dipeptidase [Cyclobacteriaceae bacterium]
MTQYPGDAGVLKTTNDMNAGGLTGAFFSLVADVGIIEIGPTGVRPVRNYATGEAWKEYKRQLDGLRELLKTLPATLATKVADLDRARSTKKVAAYLACEGGDFLDGDAGRLDEMYKDGVRSVQLVHYAPNALGDLQTEPPQHQGLSKSGKDVVKRMNKLGMVIDVAHASFKTVQDVADATDAPIILSHSLLKMEDDRPLAKRAITPEHAKLVAKTGGVIGMWPSGFNKSFEEFVDNTVRLAETVGVDHVGLGTDFDGNFKPVFTSFAQLSQWAEALRLKGLSREDVGKVLGGNARRVLSAVIK